MTGDDIAEISVLFSVVDRTDPIRIRSVNCRRWHMIYFCPILFQWSNGSIHDSDSGINYSSLFFSAIDRTDCFWICSLNGRWWHYWNINSLICQWLTKSFQGSSGQWQSVASLYICTFLWHRQNESFQHSFGKWQALTLRISLLSFLQLIKRIISESVLSIAGDGKTYTCVEFSAIDWIYAFGIC